MFVLELFFWLMFNFSLFQGNVLVISSIAEGHIQNKSHILNVNK